MAAEDAKAGVAATNRDEWYGEAADVATTPLKRKRVYRIHPAIGVARVGNAPDEYFIGPETEAFKTPERFFTLPAKKTKMPVETLVSASPEKTVYKDKKGKKSGTLADQGRIRRQAARFRIIEYSKMKDGSMKWTREITSDEAKIEWTVEVANKKAAFYSFNGNKLGSGSNPKKRKGDVITPGAKTITIAHQFDPATDSASRVELKDAGKALGYLGEILHDDKGRLVFLGGRGKANGPKGTIDNYANNDDWVDDVSDGHISATIEFPGETPVRTSDNGSTKLNGDAWVIVGPPDFAPELTNVTSLYDLMMDIAVRHLRPKVLTRIAFDTHGVLDRKKKKYHPHFESDLLRLFEATYQTATVFVPANPQTRHPAVYRLAKNARLDDPDESPADRKAGLAPKHHLRYKIFNTLRPPGQKRERDPGDPRLTSGFTLPPKAKAKADPAENNAELDRYAEYRWTMPMLWGDSSHNEDYESTRYALTETQYKLVKAWFDGKFTDTASASFAGIPRSTAITPRGLDRAALERCVGGPFYPGIEASWLTRSAQIYSEPFRVKRDKRVTKEITFGAFQSVGVASAGLKVGPGFLSQQMAQPWHTDFYDCARDPGAKPLVYRRVGWWPAQRPDDVVRGDPKAANLTGLADPVDVLSTAFKLPDPALGVPAFKLGGVAELAAISRNVTITVGGARPFESPPKAIVVGQDEAGHPMTEVIKNLPKTAGTAEGKELFSIVTEVRFDAPEDLDATIAIGFVAAGGLLDSAGALEGPTGVKAAGRTVTSFVKAGVASLKKKPRQILFTVGGAAPTEAPATVEIQGKDNKGKKIRETVALPGAAGKATSTAKFSSIGKVSYAKGNAPPVLGAKVQVGFGEFLGSMQPWDDGVNDMEDNTEKWWRLGFVVNGVETERDPTL